jgi:DNA-binding transcriptional regulator YdaS (Cro superfamily)
MASENPIRIWRKLNGVLIRDLARQVGVQEPAVCKWERSRVSSGKALAVHRATGIPLHVLRPDLYPAPDTARRRKAEAAP